MRTWTACQVLFAVACVAEDADGDAARRVVAGIVVNDCVALHTSEPVGPPPTW